jgi:hypothetical protein
MQSRSDDSIVWAAESLHRRHLLSAMFAFSSWSWSLRQQTIYSSALPHEARALGAIGLGEVGVDRGSGEMLAFRLDDNGTPPGLSRGLDSLGMDVITATVDSISLDDGRKWKYEYKCRSSVA